MLILKEKLLNEINKITQGERFISLEQLEKIEELNNIYTENCGISGTGKGILYVIHFIDDDNNKEEIAEVVIETF